MLKKFTRNVSTTCVFCFLQEAKLAGEVLVRFSRFFTVLFGGFM